MHINLINYSSKQLQKKKLNELLKRADSSIGVLQKHINYLLYPLTCKTKVSNKCDIIITYYDNNNEIGHMTIHLNIDIKDYTFQAKQNGRIHIKNKFNNSCYTLKVNKRLIKNKNDSINILVL